MWFQDEARVGQKGTLTRLWAPRAIRVRAVRDHRFKSAYIFGAVCPQRDTGVALVMTRVSPELNAIERLWQVMRASALSHRLFTDTKHIIDACCRAWNALIHQPGRIRSTCGYP